MSIYLVVLAKQEVKLNTADQEVSSNSNEAYFFIHWSYTDAYSKNLCVTEKTTSLTVQGYHNHTIFNSQFGYTRWRVT